MEVNKGFLVNRKTGPCWGLLWESDLLSMHSGQREERLLRGRRMIEERSR